MAYLDQNQTDDPRYNPNVPAQQQSPGYLAQLQQVQQQQQGQQQVPQQNALPSTQQQVPMQQQEAINPTPTGTTIPGQVVTAGMPTMAQQQAQQQANQPSGWTPPPGYLQGANTIDPNKQNGVWQGEYAKGLLAAQQQNNANQAQDNDNEKQSWNRQIFTKQQQISQGMQQAAMKGGYGAVVDYLSTADPDRAIELQKQKAALDTQMLSNQSLAMLNDEQKQKALFTGYGLLGKMGVTLLAAPQADRNNLYQTMLPMIKAVVPDAPTTLNGQATNMLMLGAGQASPDNALWQAKSDANDANSTLGRINQDIANNRAKGIPDTDPGQAALLAKQSEAANQAKLTQYQADDLTTKAQMQKAQMAKTQQDQLKAQLGLVNQVQDGYDKQSSGYKEFYGNYTKTQAAIQALQANQNDPAAQQALAQSLPRLITTTKRDNPAMISSYANTDNGIGEFVKHSESWVNPEGKLIMTPEEIGRASNLANYVYKQMSVQQAHTNSLYQDQANKYIQDPSGKDSKYGAKQLNMLPTSSDIPTKQQIDSDFQQKVQSGAYTPQQLNQAKQAIYTKYGYQ